MPGRWIEIDTPLGAALWSVLRADMALDEQRAIGVHETFSDPDGGHGRPTMLTVVGHREGAPLLRLETTWEGDNNHRKNEATRYWLPRTVEGEAG